MFLVDEDISEPWLSGLNIEDGLVGILQRPLFYPRLNALLSSKLQHLSDLVR